MRMYLRSIFAVMFMVTMATPYALANEESEPVLHLLAPPASDSVHFDQLVPEGAMKLLAAELAARHGVYVKYWPLDQQVSMPDGAYPRLQMRAERIESQTHLRLTRRGDRFVLLTSIDGKTYRKIADLDVKMPHYALAGLAAWGWGAPEGVAGKLQNVKLNGRSVEEWKRAFIGSASPDSKIARQGDTWTLQNKPHTRMGDYRLRCPFVYTQVVGDFDLEAKFSGFVGELNNGALGLMCRATTDLDSPHVGVFSPKGRQWGVMRISGFPNRYLVYSCLAVDVTATLWAAKDQKQEMFRLPVYVGQWDDFKTSVESAADVALVAIVRELKLNLKAAALPVGASPAQLKTLDEARKLVMTAHSGKILKASRLVDSVLDASPTCPEAHYTASLCGSILACQDLYGTFHDRPRFLASPMSHWILARKLGAPSRAEEKLDEAWVKLALGFPRQAELTIKSIDTSPAMSAEIRALRMFITRDYRMLADRNILEASPLEQLAWLWAAQRCNRDDLLQELPGQLAQKRRSFPFLPIYEDVGVGPGHTFSHQGISLSFARDAFDFLTCTRIDEGRRKAIAARMLGANAGEVESDIRSMARRAAWRAANEGIDDITSAGAALMDLYAEALKLPAGPVAQRPDKTFSWRCLSDHDFSDLQRGLFLLSLWRQAHFMEDMWGVSQGTRQFCDAVRKGLGALPGAGEYFGAFGLAAVHKKDQARKLAQEALAKPFGQIMSLRVLMMREWPDKLMHDQVRYVMPQCGPRGAWDLSSAARAAIHVSGQKDLSMTLAMPCLRIDPYGSEPHFVLTWLAKNVDSMRPYVAMMPYSSRALYLAASRAKRFGQMEDAIAFARRIIDLTPTRWGGFSKLARLYRAQGKKGEAIEVAKKAQHSCQWTVGLSNLLGNAAVWAAEEGRIQEALELGRRGAQSYSFAGLEGLAVALASDKQMDEALKVFRALAYRYENGSDDFVEFMISRKYHDDVVLKEIDNLLRQNTEMRKTVADRIQDGFIRTDSLSIAVKCFDGSLSFLADERKLHNLLLIAMHSRMFDRAITFSQKLAAVKERTVHQLIWTYNAARLSKRPEVVEEVLAELPKHIKNKDVGLNVQFILARIDRKKLFTRTKRRLQKSYAHWHEGIDAELSGDIPAALKAYDAAAAAASKGNSQFRWVLLSWAKKLRQAREATTKPGE